MILAMALFAVEDMFIKWAAAGLPVGQIVFVSGVVGVPIFAAIARRQGLRMLSKAALHPAVICRNLGEMLGTWGYINALATLPLSTVAAILQALPLAITMAAALFMDEQVGWRRWSAIGVGFAGVLLVIRPGIAGFQAESLWVMLSVAGMTLRDLSARAIPAGCSSSQVSAWGLASVTCLGLIMMASSGEVALPDSAQTAFLLGAVLFGTTGYWAITAASRTGEVSVVVPFRYVRLVFAILIGAFVFTEYPDTFTVAGAGLIIGSGLYSFGRERRRKRALS